jgi:hypothetical protein
MQDHICRIDENLLHRTAGPYMRVNRYRFGHDNVALRKRRPSIPDMRLEFDQACEPS